jgi:hypothetical protein
MNIKELAKQADIDIYDFMDITKNELERFAELVAAHEREECAKLCETHMVYGELVHNNAVLGCAAAIRARSKA